MFIRKLKRKNEKISLQIVQSYRNHHGKVVQDIIKNIGTYEIGENLDLGLIKAQKAYLLLKKQNMLPFTQEDLTNMDQLIPVKEELDVADEDTVCLGNLETEQIIDNGIKDIFGHVYTLLGMDRLLDKGKKQDYFNSILKSCVLMRINTPASKRKLSELLLSERELSIPLNTIYRLMDKLYANELNIKRKIFEHTCSLFKEKINVAFFDVTTLYFESFNQDELRKFGFSKDCKFKEVQVVLALMTTLQGMPLGYELFSGNKNEGHTLIECIKKFQDNYEIQNIFLVADRAMFSENNLQFMETEKINYIVAAKLRSQTKKLKSDILSYKDIICSVDDSQNPEVYSHEILIKNNRRLIVNYSKKRAKKDKKDRDRLVERIKKLEKNDVIDLKKLIKNSGSKKYLKISKSTNTALINKDKIIADERWDGLHGIITNNTEISINEALERYKELWQIEAAFRLNKHDLKMRPMFHWKPSRIKAHVLFCYICYSLTKQVTFRLQEHNLNLSFARLKEELSRVRASIIINKRNAQKYLLPKTLTDQQQKIYSIFKIPYSTEAIKIN